MITSPQEYNELLSSLIDPSEYLENIQLPSNEPTYRIDLNTRQIETPKFIAVNEDHNAEVLWFSTDRFFDCYDLAMCTCWVQYINADKELFYYAAPIIVKGEEKGHDTILIPWVISKAATKKAGKVQFAFQFFTLSEDKLKFTYVLNTLPTESIVLNSLEDLANPELDAKKEFAAEELKRISSELVRLSGEYHLFWKDVE